jgi:hypothetical protein
MMTFLGVKTYNLLKESTKTLFSCSLIFVFWTKFDSSDVNTEPQYTSSDFVCVLKSPYLSLWIFLRATTRQADIDHLSAMQNATKSNYWYHCASNKQIASTVIPVMQFIGMNISSIIKHRRYILFTLPASSSSCFCNQITPMPSTLLICKMKLVLTQKDLQIFNCNSAHNPLNIPQQHPHSDLRFSFNKSSHATAVLNTVRAYSNFC